MFVFRGPAPVTVFIFTLALLVPWTSSAMAQQRVPLTIAEAEDLALTDEETAVDIMTVKASYKPLRSQLQALGKVFAHPQKKAIVSEETADGYQPVASQTQR